MKNLLLFALGCFLSLPSFAQLACNASISVTVSGQLATLVNSSTPLANPATRITTQYSVKWGDGTPNSYSNNNGNLTHTYANAGNYTVMLYSTVLDSATMNVCRDSAWDYITVGTPPVPNQISGRIYLDSATAGSTDSVKIWLITLDSITNVLTAVDSTRAHVLAGNYVFLNKPIAQYRVKAHIDNGQTSGTGHIPTYADSSLIWSSARVINHAGLTTNNVNVYMRKGNVTGGPGFLGGNVSQGANKGTASGIEGMTIILMDANDNPVAMSITDVNGNYSFTNIANGTYKVYPENMNYATTPATVTISNGRASYNNIDFERSKSGMSITPKTSSVINVNATAVEYRVYPNPVKDVVNIEWSVRSDDKATITLMDVTGKTIQQVTATMNNNVQLSLANVHSGIYMLNVAAEGSSTTQKIVLQ